MYDFVDLFAGSGGWDLAARNLGKTCLGFEFWDVANDTRDEAKLETVRGSVLDWNPVSPRFRAKGLIASPPCQTFSAAGKGSGRAQVDLLVESVHAWQYTSNWLGDERTALVLEPLRWIVANQRAGQPYSTILLEEVPQVQPIWDAYAIELRRLGYSVWTGVLSVENFSVPQTRKRAILLASTEKTMSDPMHTCSKPVSWNEALGIRDTYSYLESNYKGGGKNAETGRWNLGRRAYGQPSFTITGKPHKIIMGGAPYRLTPAQMGVLQTFPEDYPWQGTLSDQNLQAGNAIPVKFAEALLLHMG